MADAKRAVGWDVFSWGTIPSGAAESRAFLQRRLSFLGFMVFILSAAFFPAMIGLEHLGTLEMATWTATQLDPCHVAGSAISLLLWLALRRGDYSLGFLYAVDAAYAIGVCACWSGMGFAAREYVHVEFFVLLPCVLTLAFRSATVPSSGKRTLVVSAAAMTVVAVASFLFHLRPDAPHPLGDRLAYTGMTVAWCCVGVVIAAVASHVIFGLQRRAREAQQLGQYRLVRKIGAGGMGAVYEARHAMLRRPTAIKLLAGGDIGEYQLSRFEREVQMTSALTHPNTIDIYDYGRTPDGIFYYAMEYLDGPNLQEFVEEFGPVPPPRAIHILRQVCGALAEAHEAKLIHRDIKPANIILTHQRGAHDLPKLLDFGLVKETRENGEASLTHADSLIGTPRYLSPELIRGDELDGRSDLYSLGAVAYFMITGTPVFEGKNAVVVCGEHLNTPPTPPSERTSDTVPADLEQVILKCLAKEPGGRPNDALALREALESCEHAEAWTCEDAQSWWNDYRDSVTTLRLTRAEALSASGNTIAIDLDRRSAIRR